MSKKLSEYTLGEMKEICCNKINCKDCIFDEKICYHGKPQSPESFAFADKIFFTGEEIEIAKALAKCFGDDFRFKKDKIHTRYVFGHVYAVKLGVFPTLDQLGQLGQFDISLKDIIENKGLSYDRVFR